MAESFFLYFFFSSRRRHTRLQGDWSSDVCSSDLIAALAEIKGAAALVNARLKVLDKGIASAIHEAAREVADGRWDDQFPIDGYQTGSGSSSNMNANEVLATINSENLYGQIHTNDLMIYQ